MTTTDTPTNACPHCGAGITTIKNDLGHAEYGCGNWSDCVSQSELCRERNARQKLEAEVTEIRSALGDDGRRTHKELVQLAANASQWRTWKEKYIDLKNAHIAEGQDPAGTIWEHADKLHKELSAMKKLAIELVKELIEKCPDPIHAEQLKELEK